MSTSSTSTVAGSRPARSTAARIATPPSSVAGTALSAPPNLPIGVRAALTMKTSPLERCMQQFYAEGPSSLAPRSAGRGSLEDLARHDLAVDLVRALVDLGALGVAHQPFDAGLA